MASDAKIHSPHNHACRSAVLTPILPLSSVLAVSIVEDNSSLGDIGWKGGFSVNGLDGTPTAMAEDGSRVYIGGIFSAAGNVATNDIVFFTNPIDPENRPYQFLAIFIIF